MSDLDRRYAELVTTGRVGALPPPAELRRRADRRARVRAVAAVAGAVLAVAGTVATANAVLVGPDRAGPYVGTTPSPDGTPTGPPTPSPTPSLTPPPTPSVDGPPPAADPPTDIPDRAFFVQPENTMKEGPRSLREDAAVLPNLCGADFASDRSILDRVTMGHVYKRPEDGPTYVPQGILYQTITSYRGSGARDFMSQLAEAVEDCPTGNQGDLTADYRLLDTGQWADGTLLIEVRTGRLDVEGNPAGTATNLVTVVRVGPVVTVLRDTGWEGSETVPDLHDEFTRLAVLAIEDWLS